MKTQPTASHFIDGEYVEDTGGEPIDVIYPATGEVIATVYAATQAVIERASTARARAQAEWAAMSGTERGRVLRGAARDHARAQPGAVGARDLWTPASRCRRRSVADATSGADALEYFGGMAAGADRRAHPARRGLGLYTIREPLGRLRRASAPGTIPRRSPAGRRAPALACGNAMVFKPSETTPLCALKVAEILIEAGLPAGLFNVVQGMGAVGAALVDGSARRQGVADGLRADRAQGLCRGRRAA